LTDQSYSEAMSPWMCRRCGATIEIGRCAAMCRPCRKELAIPNRVLVSDERWVPIIGARWLEDSERMVRDRAFETRAHGPTRPPGEWVEPDVVELEPGRVVGDGGGEEWWLSPRRFKEPE